MTRLVALLVLLVAATAAPAKVLVVTEDAVTYTHFTTIQAAVNAASPGDWVLIAPGTYTDPVYITTPGIHVRGMDRNAVVLDGQHQAGNGIEVWKACATSSRATAPRTTPTRATSRSRAASSASRRR